MASPSLAAPDAPSLGRRIASWALRGALAGLIMWLSVWSLQGISAFVRPVAATQPAAKPEFNPLQLAQGQDLTSGVWQFLDESGDISAARLSAAEAEQRLLAPPLIISPQSPGLAGAFQDILDLMRLQGEVKAVGQLWRFSLQQLGFQAVAFTRDQAGRELLAIRWLIPLGNREFWLVEQTPSTGGHVTKTASDSIIPKTITSRVLAARSDSSGRQVCQLLRVDSTLGDLLEQLRGAGWQIEAPTGELKPGFATIYLSRQSASCWMVASPLPDATSLRILLLNDGASPNAQSN